MFKSFNLFAPYQRKGFTQAEIKAMLNTRPIPERVLPGGSTISEYGRPDGVIEFTGPVNSITPKPTRPGDTPAKAYVGIARDVLSVQMDKHTTELLALDKDIEKLTEERRQVRITIDGMQVALTYMSKVDSEQRELPLELDEDLLVAEIGKHVFGDQ